MRAAICRTTKKSKGIALIQFAEGAAACAAKEAMDGAIFQGRLLHVLPAHRPPPPKQATEVSDLMLCYALAADCHTQKLSVLDVGCSTDCMAS